MKLITALAEWFHGDAVTLRMALLVSLGCNGFLIETMIEEGIVDPTPLQHAILSNGLGLIMVMLILEPFLGGISVWWRSRGEPA